MPRAKIIIEFELEDGDSCSGCPVFRCDRFPECLIGHQPKFSLLARPESCKANDVPVGDGVTDDSDEDWDVETAVKWHKTLFGGDR